MARTCANCGSELGEGMAFCPSCGTKVESAPEPSVPAGPLPLRAAVTEALRMGGTNLLEDPRRFASYVMDLADKGLPEVRLLSRIVSRELMLPLSTAIRHEDATSIRMAREKTFECLRFDYYVEESLAAKLSDELTFGVADYLGVEIVNHQKSQPAQMQASSNPQPRLNAIWAAEKVKQNPTQTPTGAQPRLNAIWTAERVKQQSTQAPAAQAPTAQTQSAQQPRLNAIWAAEKSKHKFS